MSAGKPTPARAISVAYVCLLFRGRNRRHCTNPLRGNSVVTTVLHKRWSSGIGVRSREADVFDSAFSGSLAESGRELVRRSPQVSTVARISLTRLLPARPRG